jgi:hypothetical protein
MIEFKENKATISELRDLVGKRCQRRTLRGWMYAGIIEAVELRKDETFVISSTGVRGTRDQRFPLDRCRLDLASEDDRASIEKDDKKLARQETKERKEKLQEEMEGKTKKLQDRINLIKRLGGESTRFEE